MLWDGLPLFNTKPVRYRTGFVFILKSKVEVEGLVTTYCLHMQRTFVGSIKRGFLDGFGVGWVRVAHS